MTGLTSTDKSDEMTAYESRLEFECHKLLTFNASVLRYEEQPVRIYFTGDDGKTHHYTPDILIHYRKDITPVKYWKPLLAEVKWRSDLFRNWRELKPRFRAAKRYSNERGFDFTVLTDKEIKTPYLDNAVFLLTFLRLPLNEAHRGLLLRTLEGLRATDPETLLRTLSEDRNKIAEMLPTLWQLVASGSIGVNLDLKLTMRSRIWDIQSQERVKRNEGFYQLSAGRGRRIRWRALRRYEHFES